MNIRKRIFGFVLMLLLVITALPLTNAYADSLDTLASTVASGDTLAVNGKSINVKSNKYKRSSGGYYRYYEMFNQGNTNEPLVQDKLNELTSGAKSSFLKDVLKVAYAKSAYDEKLAPDSADAVTDETLSDYMGILQNQTGVASTLLASLLSNVKADFVGGNKIFAPFSGPFGTALGLVAILIMALLGLTMALDLAYITIPPFQMMMGDGTGNGNESGKGFHVSGFISQEARMAVKSAEGGGGQAGAGEYKAAVWTYFKYRWKGLIFLGICLLYLVQGQIYSFVAWFLDLFSGLLGF